MQDEEESADAVRGGNLDVRAVRGSRDATDAYGPPVSTVEAIERAGAVGDLEVLDINYPFSDPDITVEEVQRALDAAGLRRGASRRTSTPASSRGGAFTNPNPAVRRRALELCEEGVDVARRLGAPTVKLWPGQDGFDYPFQADYRELWRLASRACAPWPTSTATSAWPSSTRPRSRVCTCTSPRPRARCSGSSQLGATTWASSSTSATRCSPRRPRPTSLARARPRSPVHGRGQRQLARVGRRPGGRLDPPDRDARVLPRAAQDRLAGADPARPVPVPRGPRRGGADEHRHDAAPSTRRSTGWTSTRCATPRPGRTRSAPSGYSPSCCSAGRQSPETSRQTGSTARQSQQRPACLRSALRIAGGGSGANP